MIIPEWLFQEPFESKIEKIYNPKSLTQMARGKITLDDKQLNKELARKMPNHCYFNDRKIKVGFKINLNSHHINHANSNLTITPVYPEFRIEFCYINIIIKELSVIYARLINHYKFKYQTIFSARFDKQDEDNQVLDEIELFVNFNNNHNLTETDINKIDVKSPLEYQIQQQEMKDFGWRFDKTNTMTIFFTRLVNKVVQIMLKIN